MTMYYLAHPLGTRLEIRRWEKRIEKKLGIELYNPFYDAEREDIKLIDEDIIGPYEVRGRRNSKLIVETDLRKIKESDGMIAFMNYPSIGVSMEIFYAGYILHKPVYLISKLSGHPWLNYLTKNFRTKGSLTRFLKKKLKE